MAMYREVVIVRVWEMVGDHTESKRSNIWFQIRSDRNTIETEIKKINCGLSMVKDLFIIDREIRHYGGNKDKT